MTMKKWFFIGMLICIIGISFAKNNIVDTDIDVVQTNYSYSSLVGDKASTLFEKCDTYSKLYYNARYSNNIIVGDLCVTGDQNIGVLRTFIFKDNKIYYGNDDYNWDRVNINDITTFNNNNKQGILANKSSYITTYLLPFLTDFYSIKYDYTKSVTVTGTGKYAIIYSLYSGNGLQLNRVDLPTLDSLENLKILPNIESDYTYLSKATYNNFILLNMATHPSTLKGTNGALIMDVETGQDFSVSSFYNDEILKFDLFLDQYNIFGVSKREGHAPTFVVASISSLLRSYIDIVNTTPDSKVTILETNDRIIYYQVQTNGAIRKYFYNLSTHQTYEMDDVLEVISKGHLDPTTIKNLSLSEDNKHIIVTLLRTDKYGIYDDLFITFDFKNNFSDFLKENIIPLKPTN